MIISNGKGVRLIIISAKHPVPSHTAQEKFSGGVAFLDFIDTHARMQSLRSRRNHRVLQREHGSYSTTYNNALKERNLRWESTSCQLIVNPVSVNEREETKGGEIMFAFAFKEPPLVAHLCGPRIIILP